MGLLELDEAVFKFINEDMTSYVMDLIMITLSNNIFYVLLGVASLFVVYKTKNPVVIYALCVAGLAAAASDLFTYEILKPFFSRYRPCQESRQIVRAIVGCAGRFGFPSNHATNGMAIAVTVWIIAGRRWGLFGMLVALSVGVSRVYLGMHYPSDVLGGYLVGTAFAVAIYYVSRPISKIIFGRVV